MPRLNPSLIIFLMFSLLPISAVFADGLSEGFEDVSALPGEGWAIINNSDPLGITDWGQGLVDEFIAHEGPDDAYAVANFNNTAGPDPGTISNWLLTPEIELIDGALIEFWTRTVVSDPVFPDRLEVRLSFAGSSIEVGDSAQSVGDFQTVLLTINPDLEDDGYPVTWTRYQLTLSGMPPGASGRIGLRYFVTDAGPGGTNSNYIGIDTFSVEQPLFRDRFEVTGTP
jgi:hypothetical protein